MRYPGIEQSTQYHVAGYSGETIEVGYSHGLVDDGRWSTKDSIVHRPNSLFAGDLVERGHDREENRLRMWLRGTATPVRRAYYTIRQRHFHPRVNLIRLTAYFY